MKTALSRRESSLDTPIADGHRLRHSGGIRNRFAPHLHRQLSPLPPENSRRALRGLAQNSSLGPALLALICFALAACGPSTAAGVPQGANASATSNATEAHTPAPLTSPGPSSPKSPEETRDDTPLTAYVDLKTVPERDFLTWLLVSHLPTSPSDEDKLNLFAPGYFNQSDVFKKKDIAAKALPGIQARLEEVAKMSHFIIDVPVLGSHMGPYELGTKSFSMQNCGPEQALTYGDTHRTQLVLTIPTSLCRITVDDEAKAREIEGYRAADHMDAKERAWIRIDDVDPTTNTIKATATRLHLVFLRVTLDDHLRYVSHKTPLPLLLDVELP